MTRQLKREVKIGNVTIGGTHPIAVQTMLNVPVKDIAGNVAQAKRVAAAGCQIVRVTVPTPADAAVVSAIKEAVGEIRKDEAVSLTSIGLLASREELRKRYRLTRHSHPLEAKGLDLEECLDLDEKAWNDARPSFDAVVDTTSLTAGELKQRIAMLTDEQGPTILFESFGYQYGLPLDADVILDCRAVKNPYWIKELRSQSGLDEPVREYIEKDPLAEKFMAMALEVASVSFDSALKEGRNLVVFALGCSGGQHRSVYFASRLAREFKRGRSRSFHREEKRHGHYGS